MAPPRTNKAAAATPKSPNLFAVVGSDEGKVKEAALKHSQKLTPPDAGDFGVEVIDGVAENSDHAGRICADTIQALQTFPFFGGEKLVWLKNVNFAGDDVMGRARASLDGLGNLASVLSAGVAPDVKFLLSAPEIDKRRAFYKSLNKVANVDVHDKADLRAGWEDDVAAYVAKSARGRGIRFRPAALEAFVMIAGENSAIVQSELVKLDIYLGDNRDVNLDDVRSVVSQGRGGIVFEIGDAIGKRDLSRALELVDHFLFRGESAVGVLLAAIVPKVRNLLYAKDLNDRLKISAGRFKNYEALVSRQPPGSIAHLPRKKDGNPSVYPLFLADSEARKFTFQQLNSALAACLEANHRLVNSTLEPKLVLHQLLAKILVPS